MKVAVTGASGFIGGAVVQQLMGEGMRLSRFRAMICLNLISWVLIPLFIVLLWRIELAPNARTRMNLMPLITA